MPNLKKKKKKVILFFVYFFFFSHATLRLDLTNHQTLNVQKSPKSSTEKAMLLPP